MNYTEYKTYEDKYITRMMECDNWEDYLNMRERYIKFVTSSCRWEKVKNISRKRYVGLNNARTKHFAYEAKYLPFDRNKIELYEKYQLGFNCKRLNKGISFRSKTFSPQNGTNVCPKEKSG